MVSEFKSLDTLGFPNEVARLAFEGRFWTKNYPPGVGAELPPIQEVCLDAMLRNALTLYADRTAFVFAGVAFSYAEVDGLADAFAAYLHQIGVRAGDVVAVMLPNCLQFPVCFLGALRLGCRLTLLNPMYTAREVLAQLSDSQAQTIVVLENFASTVAQVLGGTSVRHVILTQLGDLLGGMKGLVMNATVRYVKRMVSSYDLPGAVGLKKAIRLGSRGGYPKPNSQLDDVVLLQYTGGTTGVPKAAMLTNRGLMSNLSQLVLWKRAALGTAPITSLTLLPLYHIYALMVNCLLFLALGARNILIANPRDTPMVLRLIRGEKIHVLTAVNSLFNSLLNNAEFCQRDHSDLKLVLSGGMALQRAVAAHWFEVTKCAVSEGFGLTEASPVVTVPVLHAHRRPVFSGMVGVPLPDTEIRILREDGGLGGVNEVGEIFVRGPQVMLGYWRRPEETVKVLSPDGWLATGDVGVMDECGFLKLLDRKKDVIIVSGFNVYPNEVEDVIASHPKVLECAVVGVAHRIRGELVKAVVVRRDSDLNEQELLDFCRVHLTAYKVPSVLEFRDVLPKSAVGKVLRRELRSV